MQRASGPIEEGAAEHTTQKERRAVPGRRYVTAASFEQSGQGPRNTRR